MLTLNIQSCKVFTPFARKNLLLEKLEALRLAYPHVEAIMSLPSIPSPIWFSWSYDDSNMATVVDENGQIVMYRDVLVLQVGEIPPSGTQLRLTRVGIFVLAEKPETRAARLEAARRKELAKIEKDRESQRQRLRDRQVEAERENAKLRIPVRWTSGQKRVLSGLLRNSSGTGENAKTVNHVLLLEPLAHGKFQRSSGSFLCTSASGSNGQDWTGYRHSSDHGADGPYVSQITCKQCLKLAGRWDDASEWREAELACDQGCNDAVAF
jgi:hypothetical protein